MSRADDELAIRALAAAYSDAVNTRNFEGMAAIYAPDGEVASSSHGGRPVQGMEKLRKAFRGLLEQRIFLYQMTHSGVVEIDGDTAKSRWWFSEIKLPVGADAYECKYGVYQDELVRLDIGWRYKRRRADGMFTFHLPLDKAAHDAPPEFLSILTLPGPAMAAAVNG